MQLAPSTAKTRVDPKRWANAVARACLRGVVLSTCEDDRGRDVFYASQGAMLKRFEAIEEVEAWLVRLEGPKA